MRLEEVFQKDNRETKDYSSAISMITHNCKDAAHAIVDDNKLLFRSFSSGIKNHTDEFVYLDGSLSGRLSHNTENYYTLIMDNTPEWEAYPDRDKSYICTTSYARARSREVAGGYIVIPYDNVKIGMCPEYDIWESFIKLCNALGCETMGGFGEILNEITNQWIGQQDQLGVEWLADKNWNEFKQQLQQVSDKIATMTEKDIPHWTLSFFREVKYNYNGDILKCLIGLMNPGENGFLVGSYSEIIPTFNHAIGYQEGNECWFSGRAVIVGFNPQSSQYEDFRDDLAEAMSDHMHPALALTT